MSDIEMDDAFDDEPYDDIDNRCPGCGHVFDCICGTPEACDECLMYGETQCSKHGPACVEAMREEDERQRIEEAIETILSLRDARQSPPWTRLVIAAKAAQREIIR